MERPANNTDLCYLPAVQQRALIQAREISSRELLSACLERIDAANPAVNAIVTMDVEGAMRQAQDLDDRLARGEPAGPLHGLVVAHKDLIATKGMRTTRGSLLHEHDIPDHDVAIVTRMREAGAIRLGKTNVPEMGAGSHTFNPVFGATGNPYNTGRSAGGSSGGAAAALATGMVSIADGSDLGGSLRNPASFCNVVGYRSPIGRISRAPVETGWLGLSVLGAMGRTVADVAMLHAVLAGYDPLDPISLPLGTEAIAALAEQEPPASLAATRIGWSRTLGGVPVEPAVTRVLDDAGLPALAELGATVQDIEPDFTGAEFSFRTLRAWGMAQANGAIYRENAALLSDNVRNNVEWGLDITATDIQRAYTERTSLYLRILGLFEQYDILAFPTVQVPPFPIEWDWPHEVAGETQPDYLGWMRSCWYVSATGLPALSVPCGFTADGLPVGLQLVSPPHAEVELLQVALAFERVNPAWRRRPGV